MVRVPFEVVKQRAQANRNLRPIDIIRDTLRKEVNSHNTHVREDYNYCTLQKLIVYSWFFHIFMVVTIILFMVNFLIIQGPRGLYRGYFSTVTREIPFSFIQYPIWEFLKVRNSHDQQ